MLRSACRYRPAAADRLLLGSPRANYLFMSNVVGISGRIFNWALNSRILNCMFLVSCKNMDGDGTNEFYQLMFLLKTSAVTYSDVSIYKILDT